MGRDERKELVHPVAVGGVVGSARGRRAAVHFRRGAPRFRPRRPAPVLDLSLTQIFLVGLIVLAGSMLQGTVGFASALFGVPLMVLSGLELREAIAVNLVAATTQSLLGAMRLRSELPWRSTLRPMAIRALTLPLGVLTLYWSAGWGDAVVKQAVGVVLLAVVVVQWVWRVEPRESLPQVWEWVAFTTSGFMLGFVGMGGPPMVLWVMAHRWSAARSRGFLFFMFIGGTPLQAVLMVAMLGPEILSSFALGLLLIPFIVGGATTGLRLGDRMGKSRLRSITFVLLGLIAASAIVSPWI